MAAPKSPPEMVTPILEAMNAMVAKAKTFETILTPSDTNTGKNIKTGPRHRAKSSETIAKAPAEAEGQESGQRKGGEAMIPAPATEAANTSGAIPEPAGPALLRINDTLDTLTASLQTLSGNLNKMTGDLATVKKKQDFLEASWKDPEYGFEYDSESGQFYCSEEYEAEEEGEVIEPPAKKSKQDGVGTPSASSSINNQTQPQPITSQAEDAAPVSGGNSTGDQDSGLLGTMRDEFLMEEKIGAPVNSGLAKIIDIFLSKGCAQEKILQMPYARPANIQFLQKIKVNSSLWPTFNKQTKWNDVKFQQIHESIMLGMMPLIQVANTCLNKDDKKETIDDPGALFVKLKDSIAVLADTCHEVGMTRKRALKPFMKEHYRTLCGPDVPITTELFGDDLSTTAKDLGEINKLAYTITIDKNRGRGGGRPFRRGGRYRGNGRGQGPSGYNNNNNQNFTYQRGAPQQRGRGGGRRPGSGFPRARRGAV